VLANLGAAAGLTILGTLVTFFPRRFELWLGPKLGLLFMLVDARRRKTAEENMRHCLPELSAQERRKLLRQNFEHYGVLGLEIFHMFSPFPDHYRAYCARLVKVEGFEHWKRAHAKGKGTVIMMGHYANWEMAGYVGALGVPVLMATRPLKPKWVLDKITRSRHSLGLGRTAYGKRIMPELIKQLKRGDAIGFVLDQYAPPPMGVPAVFFGATVDTQAALGLFVQRTGAAIVPLHQRRDVSGRIVLRFEPEISLSEAELADPSRCATKLAAAIERHIRSSPAQWLWVHRRFKNVVWPSEQPA
jgi:Kdo2-lipid IVA lauroyltransferase/acyltransferase